MGPIDQQQGAVKASEISVDTAQPLLSTQSRDNLDLVLDRVRKTSADAFRRVGTFLLSSGNISWTGSNIVFQGNNIMFKMLQNETQKTVTLTMVGGAHSAVTFNTIALADGDIAYIELDRAQVEANTNVIIENGPGGSLTPGKTLKVVNQSVGLPALDSPDAAPQGTIAIPLAMRIGTNLWWHMHGIYWPQNSSSMLGAVITSTTIPIGAIIPWVPKSRGLVLSYEDVKTHAPGFQLCNGSVIIDPLSPLANPTRNADGTPNGPGFNSALDQYTPSINGEHFTHMLMSTLPYTVGSYVISGGIRYVCIQEVPALTSIPVTDTSYWVPESTYNSNIWTNPHYRFSKNSPNYTNNPTIPSHLVGGAVNAGTYAGWNETNIQNLHLPGHTHTIPSHGHTSNPHNHQQDPHHHTLIPHDHPLLPHDHPGSSIAASGTHSHGTLTGLCGLTQFGSGVGPHIMGSTDVIDNQTVVPPRPNPVTGTGGLHTHGVTVAAGAFTGGGAFNVTQASISHDTLDAGKPIQNETVTINGSGVLTSDPQPGPLGQPLGITPRAMVVQYLMRIY